MRNIEDLLTSRTVQSLWDASKGSREVLILCVAVLGVIAILVIWAMYFRKRDYSRTYSRLEESPTLFKRRRHRRKRRHMRRNPTLAETGGLKKNARHHEVTT